MLQDEALDKFHAEICKWSKRDFEAPKLPPNAPEAITSLIEDGEAAPQDKFYSVNEYIECNQKNLLAEIKHSIMKKGTLQKQQLNKKDKK